MSYLQCFFIMAFFYYQPLVHSDVYSVTKAPNSIWLAPISCPACRFGNYETKCIILHPLAELYNKRFVESVM